MFGLALSEFALEWSGLPCIAELLSTATEREDLLSGRLTLFATIAIWTTDAQMLCYVVSQPLSLPIYPFHVFSHPKILVLFDIMQDERKERREIVRGTWPVSSSLVAPPSRAFVLSSERLCTDAPIRSKFHCSLGFEGDLIRN